MTTSSRTELNFVWRFRADVKLLCREASMMPVRRFMEAKTPDNIKAMRASGTLVAPPVLLSDVLAARDCTKPSVSQKGLERYTKWEAEFGST